MTGYQQYIDDVINQRINTCEYIKLAIQRFNSFQNRDDMYFNADKVSNVIDFISIIKHYIGKHAGKHFVLQNWQEFIIASIYGFYWKNSGKRVTKNVFMLMSRKQGKSALAAALALYQLIADGEASPEIVFAANSREQSKIILDITTQFAKSLDPNQKLIDIYRHELKFSANKGKAKIVSADSSKLDGMNISAYIIDEYHEAKNSKMISVLSSSQGVRENPLGIIISTAGFNLLSPCKQLYDTSIEILRGVKQDDSLLSIIYTLDEGDDWDDENNWIKANPNLGVTVTKEYISDQIIKAKNNPSDEVGVRTKILNLWCSSSDCWLTNDLIIKHSEKININDFKGCDCVVGVDLAAVSDLTAVSILIYKNDKYYFTTKYYIPVTALTESKQKELYKKYYREKLITVTNSNTTDYNYITSDLLKLNNVLNINAVYYDSWNSSMWAIDATEKGFNLMPFSQTIGAYNKPTKEFERLLKNGEVIIDDNEITRFCFQNVRLKYDHNDNCKPDKSAVGNKIDGVISMLTALGGYLQQPKFDTTIYTF